MAQRIGPRDTRDDFARTASPRATARAIGDAGPAPDGTADPDDTADTADPAEQSAEHGTGAPVTEPAAPTRAGRLLAAVQTLQPGTFFEDPHVDARMRALIPRFTRLGALLVLLTAPLAAPDWGRAAILAADAALALLVTELAQRSGFLRRASHPGILLVLSWFSLQIGSAGAVAERPFSYGLLNVLPVIFGAVFFRRAWVRYALAVIAAAAEYSFAGPLGVMPAGMLALHLAALLLVARFGAELAGVLRDALRVHQSLHGVLEASTANPDEPSLAARAVEAALSVVDWHAAGVILADGGQLNFVAISGLGPEAAAHCRERRLRIGDNGLASRVMLSGAPTQVPDARTALAAENPLVNDGIRSLAGTPIPFQGEPIGVLVTMSRRPRTLDSWESDRLGAIAEQLGLALGGARAHRREAEVNARLRELNRRKDEFLATVSHELRTPATTIELAARTLRRGGERLTAEERARVEDSLLDRSRDLRELIESLLDVALTESGESRAVLSAVDWHTVVPMWVRSAGARLDRQISLALPGEGYVSAADGAKMERVLYALCSNAAKFSEPGEPIDVELRCEDDEVVISVADRGMGILPGDVERIFYPFLQLDGTATREQGGLGIGLTLVRRFVALHHGHVSVTSEVGQGSTFTVRFARLTLPREQSAG